MADLKYQSVPHNHTELLAAARKRSGFNEAYDSLELEYTVANQMLKARAKARLKHDAVAERMGTKKSAISRLLRRMFEPRLGQTLVWRQLPGHAGQLLPLHAGLTPIRRERVRPQRDDGQIGGLGQARHGESIRALRRSTQLRDA